MSSSLPAAPSRAGDVIGNLTGSPAVQSVIAQALSALLAALLGLFHKEPKAPPPLPVPAPIPAGGGPVDGLPDDHIPVPLKPRTVEKVTLRLLKAQYNRERFPEHYTDDNPFGLYPQAYLRQVERGEAALDWASKVWTDLTARDAGGLEFLRPDILAAGIAFRTLHQLGDALIEGAGADPDGQPLPYRTVDGESVGNGITAWLSSNGFVHQFKVFKPGSFVCVGEVAGVRANSFTVLVQ